ncbi:DUF7064 domain-containing protein [Pseudonocardia kujensis]|uniref:DUF7064 domain-containing protein n=1 Tax=Pseudonocardia kujensis TaxID=1128675 RepID=UPI001E33F5FF|nr:hypothetical protein [Pseudonocardia kujensis]
MLTDRDRLRHTISGPHARESVAYCLILPEHGILGHWYTWVNEHDVAGRALVLHKEGPEPVLFKHVDGLPAGGQNFDDWTLDGIRLTVGDDLQRASAAFHDDEVDLEFTFEAYHPAFDYAQNAEGCPTYLAANRYEQSGRIHGTLAWNGERIEFDGPGHRDQSWGTRDWDAIHHYKWLAVAGEDISCNLMVTMAHGELDTNGYVYRDGQQSPVTSAQVTTGWGEDWVQDKVQVTVHDDAGRTTDIDMSRYSLARWDVSPTFNFTDTGFTGTMAGAPVRAYVEYTWPRVYLDHLLEK